MGITDFTTDEQIRTNRETFRAQAMDALRRFTSEDRETAASLETEHVKTGDILKAWAQQIAPVFSDLDAKRSDARFKKTIIRNIGFSDHEAESAIEYMITSRKQALIDEVLDNLYHVDLHDVTYQRGFAENFLSRKEGDIEDFMLRYGEFIKAIDISEKHSILLLDAHGGWLERQRTALAIHKERQRITQNEDTRLEEIESQLARLTHSTDSLLGRIVDKDWNFVTILDLRSKYQKQVDTLSSIDKKNPNKRLKLFERTTASFRDAEAERLSAQQSAHNLKQLRIINEDVYNLLLEIFDLGAAERNRLLTDIQKYSRLAQERDLILLVQRNREQFLAVHG